MKKLVGILTGTTVLAPPAFAHSAEHHLSPMESLYHLLTQPDHLAMLVIAVAGVAFVAGRLSRRKV